MGILRQGDHWIWVGGPVPPGSDAITIGSLISVRRDAADSAWLLRHEEEHVRQWRELGPARFLRQYFGAYLIGRFKGFGHRAAYRMIPLEIEAEDAARRFVESGGGAGGGGGGSLS
ncbi:MAG TPA: hypothetical protein VM942_09070 [Acidimicrobiales bacterium]|nr:hypothetical protein [Acidimicrobiales bacterium]